MGPSGVPAGGEYLSGQRTGARNYTKLTHLARLLADR